MDRLAARLGRSVVIDDAQGRLVVSSGHFGEEDDLRVFAIVHRYSDPRVLAHFREHGIYAWSEPGRVPANDEMGLKARVACPIRDHGILFGHLFLIDDEVGEADVEQAVAVTEQIGQLMYRRLRMHEEAQQREADLVRGLVSAEADDRAAARARLHEEQHVLAEGPVAALVVTGDVAAGDDLAADLRTAVEAATGDRPGAAMSWVRSADAVVLVAAADAAYPPRVAERVVARLVAARRSVVCGVGEQVARIEEAAATCADAWIAARGAALLPGLDGVADAEDLGVHRLLLALPPGELDERRLPAGLRALVAADTNDALVATLAVYLERGGDATAAAAALHVHRSTFYYRLGRIQDVVGVDLGDGEQRLRLGDPGAVRRVRRADRRHPDPAVGVPQRAVPDRDPGIRGGPLVLPEPDRRRGRHLPGAAVARRDRHRAHDADRRGDHPARPVVSFAWAPETRGKTLAECAALDTTTAAPAVRAEGVLS